MLKVYTIKLNQVELNALLYSLNEGISNAEWDKQYQAARTMRVLQARLDALKKEGADQNA